MKLGAALYHLQTIELTVIDKRRRINAIGREIEGDDSISVAQAALYEAQGRVEPLEQQLEELVRQLETTRMKREASEKRLYDGSVTKPKELQDIQKEVTSLSRRAEDLEKQITTARVAVNEAKEALTKATEAYASVEQEHHESHARLSEERESLQSEVDALLEKRREHLPHIDEASLAIYNDLRKTKGNRPVSQLIDDSCSVCGVEQTIVAARAIRQHDGLSYCTNCKRILVYL